jgi:serine/threonine-protein kinase
MSAPGKDKTYEVFLSYNGEDRDAVQSIAVYLADEAQLDPWFDRWSLIPGEPWVRNLEKGLAASSSCAVFIGPSGQGPWQQPEVEAALRQSVKSPEFRVIPVLLPDAPLETELPVFLSGNTWVDFSQGLTDELARWRLECGIRGIAPGSGRLRKEKAQSSPELPKPVQLENINVAPAKKPANIFISYRHHEPDSSLAHIFAEILQQAGHQVFIDTGLRWGSDWVTGIREALERSDFLVLLLSRESGTSEMVVKEVTLARELAHQHNGAPLILPVRLRLPFTEPLPYQLAIGLHNIHQEVWNEANDTSRLAHRLLETVGEGFSWQVNDQAEVNPVGQVSALQPQFDPRSMIIPGGSVKSDSRFYIVREADEEVFFELQKSRAVVTVRGPRQTGKTSLIMGMYVALRQAKEPLRTAFIDFQALEGKSLQSRNAIWCAIAVHIAKQLKVEGWKTTDWQFEESYISNISTFLDRFIFASDKTPLLICLDEVDRLFSSEIGSKFFSSVRAFYNSGALDPSWRKVRWLLGTSSEPSFFIEDLHQSPFNIGLRVDLGAFTPLEIESFAGRHGLSFDPNTLNTLMDYVGGRPYLVHLLFYHMVRNPRANSNLVDTNVSSRSIFRDHLHSYLVQFQRQKSLASAMKNIIKGNGCEDAKLVDRLEAAGLVRRDDSEKPFPACRLYAEFFGSELNK